VKAGFLNAIGSRAHALRGERGQVLPFVAFALIVVLGMAAFAIDLSVGWMNERRAQTAADAAALAGVQDLPADPAAAEAAAQASVSKNLPGATATITTPYNSNSSEMKVTVTTSSPAFFSKIWGVSSLHESATSAAQVKTYKAAAVFAANTSCAATGVEIGNQNITISGGVRSNGPLTMVGSNHGTFDDTTYGGPNHCNYTPNSNFTFPTGYPQADPTDYSWPIDYSQSPPACTYSGKTFSFSGGTIPSGTYCATGSITVSGGSGNVTFVAPSISITGNNVNLTPYSGKLLLYQTGSGTLTVAGNNGDSGWIFAPNATVSMSGNNGSYSGFIEALNVIIAGNNWNFTGNGPNIMVSASLIL
jgi:hypothetical protein